MKSARQQEDVQAKESFDLIQGKQLLAEQKQVIAEQREFLMQQKKEAQNQSKESSSTSERLVKDLLQLKAQERNTTQKPPWDYNWDRWEYYSTCITSSVHETIMNQCYTFHREG